MKISEIRALQESELTAKMNSLYKELFALTAKRKLNQVEKPHMFSLIKKDIARIKTILNDLKKQKKENKVEKNKS
jgi:large subunit ribosomal protein L29